MWFIMLLLIPRETEKSFKANVLFYVNMEYTLENINIHKPCQYPLLFLIVSTKQGSVCVEGEVNLGGRKEKNRVLGLEMAQGFTVLTTSAEDLLSSHTQMAAHNYLYLKIQGIQHPLLASTGS